MSSHQPELHETRLAGYAQLAALDSEAAAVPGRTTPTNLPLAKVHAELEAAHRRGAPVPSWFDLRARLVAAGMGEGEANESARELRADLGGK